MRTKMKGILWGIVLGIAIITTSTAQGSVFGITGGPTLSNQKVNGFQREPFLRYHAQVFIESSSEVSPNSLYATLGYHIKGSAVNVQRYYDTDNMEHPGSSYSMEFHNLSLGIGVKQRREFGQKYFSYGFGVRGDYNVKGKFGYLFSGLEGAQNKITYGVDVTGGIELPLSELVSVIIELGVSPDLSQQMYIPPQDTGYNYEDGSPVILPETKLTNVVFEA
ncbi:MAG: hypothetical protein ABIR93_02220, partial [Saprospiraceae bacterium]